MALAASPRYTNNLVLSDPDREMAARYDEAIAALGTVIDAIAEDDIEARCSAVWAATEAITTLYLNLDVNRCGEITDELADAYGNVLSQLSNINLYNDSTIAEEAIEQLEPLREPWEFAGGTVSAYASTAHPRGGKSCSPAATPDIPVAVECATEARSPK